MKRVYLIALGMSLAIGLTAVPVDDAWSKTTSARTVKQKVKPNAKARPKGKPKAMPKAKARPVASLKLDPAQELDVIRGEASELSRALETRSDDMPSQQKVAELALRAARAAERALSRGDEPMFQGYRTIIETHLAQGRPGLEAMSARGVGAADFALGTLALHGMLEEGNVERACGRFAAALAKGFAGAKFRHAQCIEESDPARALALMQEAADSGHVAATERLGRICLEATPPDAPCAFARFERAAREGRASAMTLLGWMHAEGTGGTVDLARAAQFYREAAQKGEPSARNNLGEFYESGRGVVKDEAIAFEHYLASAEAGFPPAQFNLGRLYVAGRGTSQNIPEARRWLSEAAKAGVSPAQDVLDMIDRQAEK